MKKQFLILRNILLLIIMIMVLNACGKKEIAEPINEGIEENETEQTKSEKETDEVEEESETDTENDEEQSKIESLIDSLEVYGDKEPYAELYSMSSACDNIPDLNGTWNKTNIHNSLSGEINISDVDSNGFHFTADEFYFSHSGWMEGEAEFVTDNCAVAKYADSLSDSEEYIVFLCQDGEMKVLATGSSADLGFGMNVSMDGDYTREEPYYTNENILNETFSEEELSTLREHIPEDYYEDFFLFSTTSGVVNVTESDNGDRTIEVFVPTMGGYGYSLTISNEKDYTITFEDGESFSF